MRTDQYIGLTEKGVEIIKNVGERILYFIHGTKTFTDGSTEPYEDVHTEPMQRQYDEIEGAFGNSFPLYEYTLQNGRVVREAVQATPWSSGPCFFIALKDEEGNWIQESLWSNKAIHDNL